MSIRFYNLVLLFFTITSLSAQNCFFASASNLEASPGSNVCIKVHVHNYENIVGMQYSIVWDTLVLDFTETKDYGLPGIGLASFGTILTDQGILTFGWADPLFIGSDKPDRTHAYSVCFDVIGELDDTSKIDFIDSPIVIEIVDGNFQPIGFNKIPGEVVVKAIPTGGEKLRSAACITSPSCLNNEESSLRLAVEGGQDPISISWTGPNGFTSTDYDFVDLEPGMYFVEINDGVGFSRIDSFEVEDLIPRLTGSIVKDAKCFGQQNGTISITVEHGTPDYTFNWSNGSFFEDLSGLLPGTYQVTFTDAVGCSGTADFSIGEPAAITMDGPDLTCPGLGDQGLASFTVNGGVEPYAYFWSTGDQTSTGVLGNLAADDYRISVTDANNCPFVVNSFSLETGIDSLQAMYFTCGGSDVPLNIFAANATTYDWSPASLLSCSDCPNPSINTTMDTTITVTIGTATGCTQMASLAVITDDECVWPGDCNNDGIANYLDVLWIGLANGATGLERTVQSTDWLGLGAMDWMESTPVSMIDYKFIDADGNGIINQADIDPINSNYNLEHNFIPPNWESKNLTVVPPLMVSLPDTVEDDTALELDLLLGSTTEGIASAYGLGFQLQYDDRATPESVAFTQDGWLGNDLWEVNVNIVATGMLEVGLTRTDGTGVSGAGKIGTLAITFETVFDPTVAEIKIQNAYLINENEGVIALAPENSSTVVVPEIISSIKVLNPQDFKETISPNPAVDIVYVKSDRIIDSYELISLEGKRMQQGNLLNMGISIEDFSSGVYFLKLIGADGITTHKLIK